MATLGTKIAASAASLAVLAIGWKVGSDSQIRTGRVAAVKDATSTSQPTSTDSGYGVLDGDEATPTSSPTATTSGNPSTTKPRSSTPNSTPSTSKPTTKTTQTPAPTKSGLKDGVYDGPRQEHRFGAVTVKVTIAGGKISDVSADAETDDPRSKQIADNALPVLRSAVIKANSANVATVSGATYTSTAYKSSLQAALDKAK